VSDPDDVTTDFPRKKTEPEKGEQMKRLVLLSVGALMLAATVFAPAGMAQDTAVDITSVTLGTGGTVNVSGTIQCTEGDTYTGFVEVRQTTGNRPFNRGENSFPDFVPGECSGEAQDFTTTVVGEKPFKKGTALVSGGVTVCDPTTGSCSFTRIPFEEFRLR
jgi:hypothetical protein